MASEHVIAAFRDGRVGSYSLWLNISQKFSLKIYVGGVIYFGLNCALASIGAFLPTVITTFGYSALLSSLEVVDVIDEFQCASARASAQLMTVPPYLVAAMVMVLFSISSDRCQIRGPFMTVASLIGAFGYLFVFLLFPLPGNLITCLTACFWEFRMITMYGISPPFA